MQHANSEYRTPYSLAERWRPARLRPSTVLRRTRYTSSHATTSLVHDAYGMFRSVRPLIKSRHKSIPRSVNKRPPPTMARLVWTLPLGTWSSTHSAHLNLLPPSSPAHRTQPPSHATPSGTSRSCWSVSYHFYPVAISFRPRREFPGLGSDAQPQVSRGDSDLCWNHHDRVSLKDTDGLTFMRTIAC